MTKEFDFKNKDSFIKVEYSLTGIFLPKGLFSKKWIFIQSFLSLQ